MSCNHKTTKVEEIIREDYEENEYISYERVEYSTFEDIDVGRMRCSICGAIEYYTGRWKDFWENGTPCLGSDKFKRE